MDLLFTRYASPFLFIEQMIQTGRFFEFVVEFTKTINEERAEEKNWEFFLHKVHDQSYADFVESLKNDQNNRAMSEQTIENTVQDSLNILNGFKPTEGGESKNGII